MAKNYIQPGNVLTLLAPYDVLSGAGFLVGSIFAVAQNDALSGAEVEGEVTGVYELAKTSAQAWTVGQKIYWDNATKLCTTAAAAGANALIGVATAVAANPSATGSVRLSAGFTI